MKKLASLILGCVIFSFSFSSCEKEIETPAISSITCYKQIPSTAITAAYYEKIGSTSPFATDAGKQVMFLIKTNSNYVAVWPGERLTAVKSVVGAKPDSTFTLNGKTFTVFTTNGAYEDLGIPRAQGLSATKTDSGYICYYKYINAGDYKVNVVLTNGDLDETKQIVLPYDISVK